jgi:hypothetical protein
MGIESTKSLTCDACSRIAPAQHHDCDGHAPCPGYGSSADCPPLIVLAVQECASFAPASFFGQRFGHA